MQLPNISRNLLLRCVLFASGSLLFLLILFFSLGGASLSSPLHLADGAALRKTPDDVLDQVSNRTLGFQKIFVINLPSRTDHRDAMSLAAALTDLDVEYVDGVTEVEEKTLPPGGVEAKLTKGAQGNWRAHLNVARKIIEQNITSALVLEDDADWDLRIKSQMRDFARASQMLVQPLVGTTDRFLDPTFPQPMEGQGHENFMVGEKHVESPTMSPYGDVNRWDLLWIGHCGVRFPQSSDKNTPLGRVVIPDDQTVPEPQHIGMQFGNRDLIDQYPPHTRVVSAPRVGVCTLAYGISQLGARRILYELGLMKLSGNTDLSLRSMCDGEEGRQRLRCLTVQPQLFQHHRPVGSKAAFSDISGHGNEYNKVAFTKNVRWSTRLNFAKLINGDTSYIDLFRDGEKSTNIGYKR